MQENFFLDYVKKGFNTEHLTYIYVGAVENVLINALNLNADEQIKRLNEIRKDYEEALKLIE
ncbi:hypothetical protein [Clostridium massiliodielmoense]|uniref:hypothetical protein n=1 Tax=Clostridium massiliodielmoense TaxID=1776385 RepID=UPI000A26D768|nr:hypothetical protein [Clostridium massiliodielmoense]